MNTFENVHLKCTPWFPLFRFLNMPLTVSLLIQFVNSNLYIEVLRKFKIPFLGQGQKARSNLTENVKTENVSLNINIELSNGSNSLIECCSCPAKCCVLRNVSIANCSNVGCRNQNISLLKC